MSSARWSTHTLDPGPHRVTIQATARFHDPSYAAVWSQPGADDEFAALRALLLRGLRA